MKDLVFYLALLLAVLAHLVAAAKMYREINLDKSLTFAEKNNWKLKALVFPALFWYYYRNEKRKRNF
jgi:hypothetical protein